VRWRAVAAFALACQLCSSCGNSAPLLESLAPRGTITVFAGLADRGLHAIGKDFERTYPREHGQLSFGGSSALVAQIQQVRSRRLRIGGSANCRAGHRGAGGGFADDLCHNRLESWSPSAIRTTSRGFRTSPVRVSWSSSAPLLFRAALRCAGLARQRHVKPATRRPTSKFVPQQGALGEPDAGIVYVTDVQGGRGGGAGGGNSFRTEVVADYPVVVLKDSRTGHWRKRSSPISLVRPAKP